MTIVVGYIDRDGDVWIGADTLTTSDHFKWPERVQKVFRAGPWLIGVAGSSLMLPLLKNRETVIADFTEPGQIGDLATSLSREFDFKKIEADGYEPSWGTNLIIGSVDGLWRMAGNGFVLSCTEEFVAIGAGEDFAYGAWHATKSFVDTVPGYSPVVPCLDAACAFDVYCAGPYTIMKAEPYEPAEESDQ